MSDLLRFERPCPRQGPFARPALPGVLTTMNPSDSRPGLMGVIDSPHPLMPAASPGRVSQVPRLICRRPPPPITPESLTGAPARCFPVSGRLRPSWRVGRSHWFNEAESGSLALRLTSSPQRASTIGSPRAPPLRLHAARAINMVSTFQLTRSARLRLAHQREQRPETTSSAASVSFVLSCSDSVPVGLRCRVTVLDMAA